jgi:Ca2+-binding RTX toxin-like protein
MVALTGDARIDGLVQGSAWQLGADRTLTYSFDRNFGGPSQDWTGDWKTAVTAGFDVWSRYVDLRFAPIGVANGSDQNVSTADISLALSPEFGGLTALGFFPDPQFADLLLTQVGYSRALYPAPEGDITFNPTVPYFASLNVGSAGFEVILHEIGHSLGLKHADDDGGNGRPNLPAGLYSIMDSGAIVDTLRMETPMPADVLALQEIYGANTRYHRGDDVYTLSSGHFRTLWDAGGTDTLKIDSGNGKIDLRPGEFSGAGRHNFAIAYGVTIENAIGGDGWDQIWGNRSDNELTGRGNNDSIIGGAGDDKLAGGAGHDSLNGGKGHDTLAGGDGNDLYFADGDDVLVDIADGGLDVVWASGTVTLGLGIENLKVVHDDFRVDAFGNAGVNWMEGSDARNQFKGGRGADVLLGEAGKDLLYGEDGADELGGGSHDDFLGGGNGNDRLYGEEGIDTLLGGAGADSLRGGNHAFDGDSLDGGAGDDILTYAQFLSGGEGHDLLSSNSSRSDVLDGGSGADTMYGSAGADLYIVDDVLDVVVDQPLYQDIDTVRASVNFELPDGIENLVLLGSVAINGRGNELNNKLMGNKAENHLSGEDGDDALLGAGGDDLLDGGLGENVLKGGLGNDVYRIGLTDTVVEAVDAGHDIVESTVTFTLPDNVEDLLLTGSDSIDGAGNALANRISGNSSDNMLTGGAGGDRFVFAQAAGAGGVDEITDFAAGEDAIELAYAFFAELAGPETLLASEFVANTGAVADSADQRILYDTASGALYYDADGNGDMASVQFALLSGTPTLTADDFRVI